MKKFFLISFIVFLSVAFLGGFFYLYSVNGFFVPNFHLKEYEDHISSFSYEKYLLKYGLKESYGVISSPRQATLIADSIFKSIWGNERLLLVKRVSYDSLNKAWCIKSGNPSSVVILSEKEGKILAYWSEKF